MNDRSIPDLSAFYRPDIRFTNSFEPDREHVGLEAVSAWYARFLGSRSGYYRWVRHKISGTAIAVDGDTARTSAYCDADSVDRHGRIRAMAGRYDDVLLKADGRWLISQRHDSVLYHHTAGDAWDYSGLRCPT